MNTLEAILTRRSCRKFSGKPIESETLHQLLEAAMSGPSCVNAKDWSFVVVTDPEKLAQMADANGRPAEPLRHAAAGILVCGDLDRAFRLAKDYWVIDGAIAAQNICLAAQELGLGAVWLGTWPQMDRVDAQQKLFGLLHNFVLRVIALQISLVFLDFILDLLDCIKMIFAILQHKVQGLANAGGFYSFHVRFSYLQKVLLPHIPA